MSDFYNSLIFSKGLLLNATNQMYHEILKSEDKSLIKKFGDWRKIKEQLAKAYTQSEQEKTTIKTDSLEKSATQLERELNQQSKAFAQIQSQNQTDWKAIQQTLKADECAVEIVRLETNQDTIIRYVALILTPETKQNPELIVLKNGYEMEQKLVKLYRNLIKFKRPDSQSYENFFGVIALKIKELNPNAKKIYFSPDGVYHQVNLQTLFNPETQNYVLNEWDIYYVSNTRELVLDKEKGIGSNLKKEAVLFGYPQYDLNKEPDKTSEEKEEERSITFYDGERDITQSVNISELPATKAEVEQIRLHFQENATEKWHVKAYLAHEATEATLKDLDSPGVLHIATHGYFLSDVKTDKNAAKMMHIQTGKALQNPLLRSGLMLAGAQNTLKNDTTNVRQISAQNEDGILTAYEVSNLNLFGTELVVLSACETGLGEIRNGQGVYGLQRSFAVAGAERIVMSLWTVNDEATGELMKLFYQNWLSGMAKYEALRQAQLSLQKDFPHPYYWGAFVMIEN